MESRINDKVVAITGASSGIGEATALLLARQGANVVMGARRTARLAALQRRLNDAGGTAVYLATDVRKREDLLRLVAFACDQYGRLDVMINNAGISRLSRMDELDVDGWDAMVDVNLRGVLYGIAAAIPVFKRQGSGHIINVVSTSGIKIVPTQGVYAATKNAVRTVSEALRQESDGRWRVTGISPGFVQSELADTIADPAIRTAIQQKAATLAIPPDAIARAIVYAMEQPEAVEVGDIIIRPSAQD